MTLFDELILTAYHLHHAATDSMKNDMHLKIISLTRQIEEAYRKCMEGKVK